MSPRARCGLLIALAALLGGCGSDDTATTPLPRTVPDPAPTAAQLAAIRSTPDTPIYWLGPRFAGNPLTRAKLTAQDPANSIFQYGEPTCRAGAGCSYPLGVATVRERAPAAEEPCWAELGEALVLGCAGSTSLQIYTGAVEVFIQSADGRPLRAARALRLKTAAATATAPLAAPRPFSCEQVERFADAFRAALPAALRPVCG